MATAHDRATATGAVCAAVALGAVTAVDVVTTVLVAAAGVTVVVAVKARNAEPLLHLLVLSLFAESATFGAARVGRILGVAVVVVLALRMSVGKVGTPLVPRIWFPAGLLFFWAWGSALWAQDGGAWLGAMTQLGLAAAYFLAFALFPERPEQICRLLQTYVLGALGATVIAVAQASSGSSGVGLQGDRNYFALYQAAALPACILIARSKAGSVRWVWRSLTVPIALSVFASDSRGGLVAMTFAVVLLLFRRDIFPSRSKQSAGRVALASATIVVLGGLGLLFNGRLDPSHINKDRASGRLDLWYVAVQSALDRPLLGLGGGNFGTRSVGLLETTPGVQLVEDHILGLPSVEVHNIYLQLLTDYGVVGLLLFLTLLVTTMQTMRDAERRWDLPTIRALLPMLAVFALASTFLSVLNSKLLWMLVGLASMSAAARRAPAPVDAKAGSYELH